MHTTRNRLLSLIAAPLMTSAALLALGAPALAAPEARPVTAAASPSDACASLNGLFLGGDGAGFWECDYPYVDGQPAWQDSPVAQVCTSPQMWGNFEYADGSEGPDGLPEIDGVDFVCPAT